MKPLWWHLKDLLWRHCARCNFAHCFLLVTDLPRFKKGLKRQFSFTFAVCSGVAGHSRHQLRWPRLQQGGADQAELRLHHSRRGPQDQKPGCSNHFGCQRISYLSQNHFVRSVDLGDLWTVIVLALWLPPGFMTYSDIPF